MSQSSQDTCAMLYGMEAILAYQEKRTPNYDLDYLTTKFKNQLPELPPPPPPPPSPTYHKLPNSPHFIINIPQKQPLLNYYINLDTDSANNNRTFINDHCVCNIL